MIKFALVCLIAGLGALVGMGKLASSVNQEFTKIGEALRKQITCLSEAGYVGGAGGKI